MQTQRHRCALGIFLGRSTTGRVLNSQGANADPGHVAFCEQRVSSGVSRCGNSSSSDCTLAKEMHEQLCSPSRKELPAALSETTGVARHRLRQSSKRLSKMKSACTSSLRDVAPQVADPTAIDNAWLACLGGADFLPQDLVVSARAAVFNAPLEVSSVGGENNHKSLNTEGNAFGKENAIPRTRRPCSARGEYTNTFFN